MAGINKTVVQTDSVRECRFYMRYIANHFRTIDRENIVDNFSDTEICCRIINQHIRYVHTHEPSIEACIMNLKVQFLKSIIPDNNFLWLKQDKRATFWVWGELALKGRMNDEINEILTNEKGNNVGKYWYSEAKLNSSPINHEQRFNLIIDTIDFICSYSPIYASKMIIWLNNKLIEWRESQKIIIKNSWLTPENEKDCFKAYQDIKDHQESTKTSSNNNFYPVNIPEPLNAEEAYFSFYAMHDLWDTTLKASRELNDRMSKNKSQMKYRRKKKENEMLSEISSEASDKLKFISEFYKKSSVQVLENLISDRYKGIQIGINNQD